MRKSIILIGAMGAGKSTVGKLLAEELKMPQFSMDDHRYEYYAEIEYNREKARAIYSEEGIKGLIQYWKPFEAYAVERAVHDHPGHVIDLGAGHSVYDDQALFKQVQRALASHHVILLQPSADAAESTRILNDRFVAMYNEELEGAIDPAIFEINAHFVQHPSNRTLATIAAYTNGKTPEETCAEIIKQLR